MSSRFKKVSLALYLDPTNSDADNYAFKTLSGWAKRRQELSLDASATMELHQLVHVHKDIYLSGLFLYQLKPELSKSLATALATDSINENALSNALNLNQIGYEKSQVSVQSANNSNDLSDFSARIDSLLKQQAAANKQVVESKKQITTLQQLVQEQNRLIAQLLQQGGTLSSSTLPESQPSLDTKSPMLPDEPKELVEQRLAKVKKMKSKGVF